MNNNNNNNTNNNDNIINGDNRPHPQERENRSQREEMANKMPAGGGATNLYGRAAERLLKQAPVEPWPERVDLSTLLDELSGLMSRFVVLPPHAADALALWVVHTFGFELRDVTSYLGVESPEKRCGKSTLLSLLSKLVNRPVVAANISASAFFRVIEQTRPTLIIDEADTFLRKNDELRGRQEPFDSG